MQSALPEVRGTPAMRIHDVRGFCAMCKCVVKQGTGRCYQGAAFFACRAVSSARSSPAPLPRNVLNLLNAFSTFWWMLFPQSEVTSIQLEISHVFVFCLLWKVINEVLLLHCGQREHIAMAALV